MLGSKQEVIKLVSPAKKVENLPSVSRILNIFVSCTIRKGVLQAYELVHGKTYNKTCVTSEDSDRPAHMGSLISLC